MRFELTRCPASYAARGRSTQVASSTSTIGTNELIATNPDNIKPALDTLFAGQWKKVLNENTMRRMLIVAVIACMALLTSCGANRVSHTGDLTGSIYGVWALESKSVVPAGAVGQDAQNQVDYSGVHFYLSLSEPRIALAKKGSFTQLDLDDVDVDGSQFSFNAYKKRICFTKTLWLTEGLRYEMRLSGTYQVVEMSRSKLVLQKETLGVRTVYSFRRYK